MDFEHPEKTIETAINMQEAFYASIGMPTNLKMLGVKETDLEMLAFKCSRGKTRTLIGYKELAYDDILEVFCKVGGVRCLKTQCCTGGNIDTEFY
ncbi:MAG: hypothetical protein ACLTDV_00100 [Eubacterium sp.]